MGGVRVRMSAGIGIQELKAEIRRRFVALRAARLLNLAVAPELLFPRPTNERHSQNRNRLDLDQPIWLINMLTSIGILAMPSGRC
jgi:hypothetical protein